MRLSIAATVSCIIAGTAIADHPQDTATNVPNKGVGAVVGQGVGPQTVSIAPQDLSSALSAFADSRKLYLIYAQEDVLNHRTTGATGELTADETLNRLLKNTGLTYRYLDDKTITIVPIASAPASGKKSLSSLEKTSLSAYGSTRNLRLAQSSGPTAGNATAVTAAGAKTQTAGEAGRLEELVVTARRRAETAQSVPVAITAFSADALKDLHVMSGRDLGTITPGLTWKGDSPAGGNTVFLRGVGSNADSYTISGAVAVYLNDVYLSAQPLANIPTYDLERVEVLKGPQGTLYGINSTGGAVRFITNTPKVGGGTSIDASLDAGNYDYVNVEGGVGFDISQQLAARISLKKQARDGIYDNLSGGARLSDLDSEALRVQLAWQPLSNLSIRPTFNYTHGESNEVPYKRIDYTNETLDGYCANPRPGTAPGCTWVFPAFDIPGNGMVQPNPDPYSLNTSFANEDGEELTVRGGSLDAVLSLKHFEITSITSSYNVDSRVLEDVDDAEPNLVNSLSTNEIEQFSQEVRLTSTDTGPLDWVLGVYYLDQKNDVEGAIIGPNFVNYLTQKTESYAAFGEGTYRLTDKFDIAVGLRWSHDERSVDFFYGGILPDPDTLFVTGDAARGILDPTNAFSFVGSKTWSNVSGRAILTMHMDDGLAYLSFSRGYKAGEFNNGASSPATANFIVPEQVDAYEVGFKTDWFGRLRLNSAVFFYDYTDKQETFFNNGQTVLSNAQAEILGAEVELQVRPTDRLTLTAGLSWLDTEYTDFDNCNVEYIGPAILAGQGTTPVSCTGNRLTASPKLSGTLLAKYDATMFGRTLSAQVNASYRSETFFNYENVAFNSQDAYWLTNARLSYELSQQLTVAAWVQNIADEEYFSDGFNISDTGNGLLIPGRPRMFGISISYSFEM